MMFIFRSQRKGKIVQNIRKRSESYRHCRRASR
uniref:Uncharacterized protein n=1 Tax=Parascaris equorum TaxID=6256 RepID=A0A914SFA0_PAREQ